MTDHDDDPRIAGAEWDRDHGDDDGRMDRIVDALDRAVYGDDR